MAAIGCLLPLLLLFAGAALGGVAGGGTGGLWGGAAGLVIGLIAMAVVLKLFEQARQNWPR